MLHVLAAVAVLAVDPSTTGAAVGGGAVVGDDARGGGGGDDRRGAGLAAGDVERDRATIGTDVERGVVGGDVRRGAGLAAGDVERGRVGLGDVVVGGDAESSAVLVAGGAVVGAADVRGGAVVVAGTFPPGAVVAGADVERGAVVVGDDAESHRSVVGRAVAVLRGPDAGDADVRDGALVVAGAVPRDALVAGADVERGAVVRAGEVPGGEVVVGGDAERGGVVVAGDVPRGAVVGGGDGNGVAFTAPAWRPRTGLAWVGVDVARVRAAGGVDAQIVARLRRGTPVVVARVDDGAPFVRVVVDGVVPVDGYVHAGLLADAPPPALDDDPTAPLLVAVCDQGEVVLVVEKKPDAPAASLVGTDDAALQPYVVAVAARPWHVVAGELLGVDGPLPGTPFPRPRVARAGSSDTVARVELGPCPVHAEAGETVAFATRAFAGAAPRPAPRAVDVDAIAAPFGLPVDELSGYAARSLPGASPVRVVDLFIDGVDAFEGRTRVVVLADHDGRPLHTRGAGLRVPLGARFTWGQQDGEARIGVAAFDEGYGARGVGVVLLDRDGADVVALTTRPGGCGC